jgi:hypothetical protein
MELQRLLSHAMKKGIEILPWGRGIVPDLYIHASAAAID